MNKLHMFLKFDVEGFLKDKRLMSIGVEPWKDYNTGDVLGTKVQVAIMVDETNYGPQKDGKIVNNKLEKFFIRVPKKINVPMDVEVVPLNPIGKVWGEFKNQLTIDADDIRVITK